MGKTVSYHNLMMF